MSAPKLWLPSVRLEDFVRSLPKIHWKRLVVRHREFLASQKNDGRFTLYGLKLFAPGGIYHPRVGSSSDFLIRTLPAFTNKTVLDIGTGSGAIGIYLAKAGNKVTVTDVSELALQTAIRNSFLNGVTVQALNSDLFNGLPPGQKFDRLIFNYPLYQKKIEHPLEVMTCDPNALLLRRFLAELNTRLKRGGIAYLTYSNLGDSKLLMQRLRRKRFQVMVLGFEHDPDTNVVKYLTEIKRAPSQKRE